MLANYVPFVRHLDANSTPCAARTDPRYTECGHGWLLIAVLVKRCKHMGTQFAYWKRLLRRAWTDGFKFADSWGINPKKAPAAFVITAIIAAVVWLTWGYTDSMHEKVLIGAATLGIIIAIYLVIYAFFILTSAALLDFELTEEMEKKRAEEAAEFQRQIDVAKRERDDLQEKLDQLDGKPSDPIEIREFLSRMGRVGRNFLHHGSSYQHLWTEQVPDIAEKALRFEFADLYKRDVKGKGVHEQSDWLVDMVNKGVDKFEPKYRLKAAKKQYRIAWLNVFMREGNELREKTKGRTQFSEDISGPMRKWKEIVQDFLDVMIPDYAGLFMNDGGLSPVTHTGGAPTPQATQEMEKRLQRLGEILDKVLAEHDSK